MANDSYQTTFIPRHVESLPTSFTVGGVTFGVGPIDSPLDGPHRLPADLIGACNAASALIQLALRLLVLMQNRKGRSADGLYLVKEIKRQPGIGIVSALHVQLTAANKTGGSVRVGPVRGDNAHEAAFVATLQIARDAEQGKSKSSVTIDALEDLLGMVENEACTAANTLDRKIPGLKQFASGLRGDTNKKDKEEKLSAKALMVRALIRQHSNGITGPQIVQALGKQKVQLELSTLYTHIIPKLKEHGLKNRPGAGYYIPST